MKRLKYKYIILLLVTKMPLKNIKISESAWLQIKKAQSDLLYGTGKSLTQSQVIEKVFTKYFANRGSQ